MKCLLTEICQEMKGADAEGSGRESTAALEIVIIYWFDYGLHDLH